MVVPGSTGPDQRVSVQPGHGGLLLPPRPLRPHVLQPVGAHLQAPGRLLAGPQPQHHHRRLLGLLQHLQPPHHARGVGEVMVLVCDVMVLACDVMVLFCDVMVLACDVVVVVLVR